MNTPAGHIENFVGWQAYSVTWTPDIGFDRGLGAQHLRLPMAWASAEERAWPSLPGIPTIQIFRPGVQRSPVLVCHDEAETVQLAQWLSEQGLDFWQSLISPHSRYTQLLSTEAECMGPLLFWTLTYDTGQAAGQNMVTLATQVLLDAIQAISPYTLAQVYVEGNLSGDKKMSPARLLSGRGWSVQATVEVPKSVANPSPKPSEGWQPLAGFDYMEGFFRATGQDLACLVECAWGRTHRWEGEHSLFYQLQVPCLLLGTVGGGTRLADRQILLRQLLTEQSGSVETLLAALGALLLAADWSQTENSAQR